MGGAVVITGAEVVGALVVVGTVALVVVVVGALVVVAVDFLVVVVVGFLVVVVVGGLVVVVVEALVVVLAGCPLPTFGTGETGLPPELRSSLSALANSTDEDTRSTNRTDAMESLYVLSMLN